MIQVNTTQIKIKDSIFQDKIKALKLSLGMSQDQDLTLISYITYKDPII